MEFSEKNTRPKTNKLFLCLLCVVILVVSAVYLPPLILRIIYSERKDTVEAVNNMADLKLFLYDYAEKNEKNYPPTLQALVNDGYTNLETLNEVNQAKTSEGNKPFIYISGYKTTDEPDTIILYMPEPIDGKRGSLRVDGAIKLLAEENFQSLLEKQKAEKY